MDDFKVFLRMLLYGSEEDKVRGEKRSLLAFVVKCAPAGSPQHTDLFLLVGEQTHLNCLPPNPAELCLSHHLLCSGHICCITQSIAHRHNNTSEVHEALLEAPAPRVRREHVCLSLTLDT